MNTPGVNAVVSDALDPWSMQPELKHAAVRVEKMDLPWPLTVIRRCPDQASALQLLQSIRPLLADFPFATLGLYGRKCSLVVFRAALPAAPAPARLAALDVDFGLDAEAGRIVFVDAARQVNKLAITQAGRLLGVRLSGEDLAQTWLKAALAEDELESGLLRYALAPSALAPVSVPARNIVCKCADVSYQQILASLQAGCDISGLQENLKCGTFCGACMPDIRRMQSTCIDTQAQAA